MKIRQIQYYLTVAEIGSFTGAAEELYVSQSALSKQIISLEDELGCALFDRSRRKVALTRAGEAFLRHARDLNAGYLAMRAEMSAYRATPSFSILSIPVIAQYGITSVLAQFRAAYPKFDYTLEEREPLAIFRALTTQTHDLAFVRDNYLDTDSYASLVVAQDRLLVAVPRGHRLASRPSVQLGELAGEDFVIYDRSTLVDELVLDACHRAGFEPRVVYTSLRIESILGQVASGSGIALVMEQLFHHSRHRDVVGIALDEPIPSNLVLAWVKDRRLSLPAKAFGRFLERTVPHAWTP